MSLPFEQAIAFFGAKTNATSEHWTDVWQRANARAFTVAGAATDALVSDFRAEIEKALEKGTTLAEFRKGFDQIVAKHGWEHTGTPGWRSRIIYETNLSMAYAAGRYSQQTEPETLAQYPYWQYVHSGSLHPRLNHLAWNGLTLRADDSWWDTHYPPNGWRCGCRVRPLSARGLARQGKAAPDQAPPIVTKPWVNPKTGEVHDVPVGIDPSFDYNPGQAWLAAKPAIPPNATFAVPPLRPAEPVPKPKAPPKPTPEPKFAPAPAELVSGIPRPAARSRSDGEVKTGRTRVMLPPRTTAAWHPADYKAAVADQSSARKAARAGATPAEAEAFASYLSDGYLALNQALRDEAGRIPAGVADLVGRLDAVVARSKLPTDLRLHRGTAYVEVFPSVEAALQAKGAVYVDDGYFSTTLQRSTAEVYGEAATRPPAPAVVFTIRARAGMAAAPGTDYEVEYVFPRGQRWRILDVQPVDDGAVHVLLEPA
nr:phage minor head protein [Rhodoplanes tepidamans]